MRLRHVVAILLALCAAAVTSKPALAESKPRPADEEAIRAAAKAYLAALARGDGKAVADAWTSDGELIDAAGKTHSVKEIVGELADSGSDGKPPSARFVENRIRFLTDDVAIEDGVSEIAPSEGDSAPVRGHYHATWVRRDGRWRLAALHEAAAQAPPATGIAQLEPLVGQWIAESGPTKVEIDARWNSTGAVLLRDTKVTQDGKLVFSASQRIAVDPESGKLHSWSFDDDGGHSEAVWTQDGDRWSEHASGVLADGRDFSAVNVIQFSGDDMFQVTSTSGRLHAQAVPDRQLQFKRRAAAKP